MSRKKKNWVRLSRLCCTLAAILTLSVSAEAYVLCDYKMSGSWPQEYYYLSTRVVTYNSKTVNYGNITDDAVQEWNDAVNMTSTSTLNIELSETTDGDAPTTRVVIDALDRGPTGWRGHTYYHKYNALTGQWSTINYGGFPNQNYTSGSAVINLYYVHDNPSWKIQNTIMHEMGHIFGLKHSLTEGALMIEGSASYTSLTPPQSDDVNGVRALYSYY